LAGEAVNLVGPPAELPPAVAPHEGDIALPGQPVGGEPSLIDRGTADSGFWKRLGDRWEREHVLSGAVYGTITVGALLAAESDRHESTVAAIAATTLALCIYWIAHAYTHALERRAVDRRRLGLAALGRSLSAQRSILEGAIAPIIVLAVVRVVGASTHHAVLAALWTSALGVVALEVLAGAQARMGRTEILTQALFGSLLGLAIIAVKLLLG
jgi:DMSO/TMAO reductase YedYZ heme-binding membrane subunit